MSARCTECRDDLLARDAGELSTLRQERVDAHLRGCPACRTFRAELGSLIAAGRSFAPAPTPEERDALYDAVARETRAAPSRRSARVDRRGVATVLALAAAVALAVLGFAWRTEPTTRARPVRAAASVQPSRPTVAPTPLPEPLTATDGVSSPEPGVAVRAPEGARWDFDRATRKLTLHEGAIWVSVEHGASGRPLSAEGPGLRVTVTGTVLFLRTTTTGTDVGVLSGHVLVRPATGAPEPLRAGWVRLASGETRVVEQDERHPAREWLPHAPDAPIAQRAAAIPREAPEPLPAGPPTAADLYRGAEEALATGDAGRAADQLRRLVQTWPMTPEAGTARLELARLYAGPLHRPELAIAQLRRFLASRDAGGAASAARAELCRLLPPDERVVEASCAPNPR